MPFLDPDLAGGLTVWWLKLVQIINRTACLVVAVDMPSGLLQSKPNPSMVKLWKLIIH